MWTICALAALGLFAISADAVGEYKVCATDKYISECQQLQRGNPEVLCQYVQDSIECAARIRNGTADFGKFSAESVAHIGALGWTDLTIVKELRHKSRQDAPVDFEVVVLVRSNHSNGLVGLKNKGYCHRGFYYGKSHRWTENFLKYFERQVVPYSCNASSMAEVEALSVSRFFSKACRPGIWSHDRVEDAELKSKYSNLCELCDNKNACTYLTDDVSQVFECLDQGDNVAFVSLQEARRWESSGNASLQYGYLCPNGSLQAFKNNSSPCTWIKEPWDAIVATASKSIELQKRIESWMLKANGNSWQSTLFSIIVPSSFQIVETTIQSPGDHMIAVGRGAAPKAICNRQIYWCTISGQEKDKCEVARAGAITSGVQPLIECLEPAVDTVDCIAAISQGRADFMGIDSNYGYLARSLYNLTAALYFETQMDQYSSVVAVVRDGSKYKTFESLRGARACIPEFGGTASIAFVNVGKARGFMDRQECRYGSLMSSFFGESCAPGARDYRHQRTTDLPLSLCDLCQSAPVTTEPPQQYLTRGGLSVNISGTPSTARDDCSADEQNPYYGNDGALKCLNEVGEVAILELQSLSEHAKNMNISENNFRVICRNGSLAAQTGFDVDAECALTTIVDGEVVVRRGSSKTNSIISALSAIDSYFQTSPDFKIYNIFDSTKHLLFKDSTIGLIGYNEEDLPMKVKSYKKLFEYVESCKQGNAASPVTVTGLLSMLMAICVSIFLAF